MNKTANLDTPFIDNVKNGTFQLLCEFSLPGDGADIASIAANAATQANSMTGFINGVMLSGRPHKGITPIAPELYLRHFSQHCQLPVISVFSGRIQNDAMLDAFCQNIASSGHNILCMVTGQLTEDSSGTTFYESIDSLRNVENRHPGEFCCGATVNPAQYHHQDTIQIYDKMLSKLDAGACFLIIPAQWDMRKAQELKWFLDIHERSIPIFAEVEFFHGNDVKFFRTQPPEHTVISEGLLQTLLRDLSDDPQVLLQEQLKRLAMQIVGYRRIGYSAVIVKGVDNANTFHALYSKIENILQTYPDYESWRNGWLELYDDIATPSVYPGEYLYRDLLPAKLPHTPKYAPAKVKDRRLIARDRLLHFLHKFADGAFGCNAIARLYARLFGLSSEYLNRVRATEYLDNDDCPKHLTKGACGELANNGRCGKSNDGCFFCRVQCAKKKK